ncbi:30S ribosomal protein S8 [Nannocystis bainbridge]|uniref:Small ribosomal subunit protein uS8 n=1 Tax=Nannocystis bainbridge TaxID=2995303 RepID=A0ABT5E7N4_9BACT|nr:30S ribosomal protein S8 [Nannocystis bainbridge]MDC0721881.1 30S ribosomal protein S8 [Nannocystis bainbridge]
MSMTDPIADMLARIRNAQHAQHPSATMPGSKQKLRICQILKEEGYILDFSWEDDDKQGLLSVKLKYQGEEAAIEGMRRISRPGQRAYSRGKDIPKVHNGLGILIVSTSRGLMTDRAARRQGIGGELICSVW